MFSILNRFVNGVKKGVEATLEGVSDVGSELVGAVKDVIVTTVSEGGKLIAQGVDGAASVVKGAIKAVGNVGSVTVGSVRKVVQGTVAGFIEEDGDQEEAIRGAVGQAVYSAKELGLNIGDTAVEAVKGAVEAVGNIGGNTVKATEQAIKGVLTAAKDISKETLESVEESVKSSFDEGERIVKSFKE